MLKTYLPILSVLALWFLFGCDNIYKAGNRVTLDYAIETKLNYRILRLYIDSLTINGEHKVPDKWRYLDKLVDELAKGRREQ